MKSLKIFFQASENEKNLGSLAAVICMDGCLRILSLNLLDYVQEIKSEDKKFSSITYCHSKTEFFHCFYIKEMVVYMNRIRNLANYIEY